MGTKYTAQSVSSYNATPPSDDGTVSEANKVKYSTVKTKLTDPLNTFASAIDTALTNQFNRGPTALTSNTTLGATHYNQFIQASGANVTLTLTDANTLAAGWFTDIHNTDTSNNIALARATASNTIDTVSADTSILPLESLRVFVNAAATGFITDRRSKTLVSLDAGAAIGPVHTVYRDSASPAASDLIGGYVFDGEDSGSNRTTYARIYAQIDDPGNTSEDGSLKIDVMKAGTLTLAATLSGTALNLASGWTYQINGASAFTGANGCSLVTIASVTADNTSANIQFTSAVDWTLYDVYEFDLVDLVSTAAGAPAVRIQVTTDGGSTWKTTNEYDFAQHGNNQVVGTTTVAGQDTGNMDIQTSDGLANSSSESLCGSVRLYAPNNSSVSKIFMWDIGYQSAAGGFTKVNGGGRYQAATAVNGVRFVKSSGNWISGTVYVRGRKNS